MIIVLNCTDIAKLTTVLPEELMKRLLQMNAIVDDAYGPNRDPWNDDGGYNKIYGPNDEAPDSDEMEGPIEKIGDWNIGVELVNNETAIIHVWQENLLIKEV
jgi:hypothetical protein